MIFFIKIHLFLVMLDAEICDLESHPKSSLEFLIVLGMTERRTFIL